MFKDHMGMSFHQYVIRLRLERARQMLSQDGIGIQEVIEHLNISHSSNFFADFKRAFQVTPAEFRKRERAQTPDSCLPESAVETACSE